MLGFPDRAANFWGMYCYYFIDSRESMRDDGPLHANRWGIRLGGAEKRVGDERRR